MANTSVIADSNQTDKVGAKRANFIEVEVYPRGTYLLHAVIQFASFCRDDRLPNLFGHSNVPTARSFASLLPDRRGVDVVSRHLDLPQWKPDD